MKTTLLFLSVFLSTAIFSQETFKSADFDFDIIELIKIAKMDRESFEMYAMERGNSYNKIESNEDYNALYYSKRIAMVEDHLKHYTKFFDDKFSSGYETNNVRLLSLWYKQLKDLGFKVSDSGEFDGSYNKVYIRDINGKEEIEIYIENDWLEISYTQKK